MISIKTSGSFSNTDAFLQRMKKADMLAVLDKYGADGVNALSSATPFDTGKSADSWKYEVYNRGGVYTIVWINTNINDGVPIVILLQYGHGTGTGGYVKGYDYINPAIRPVMDRIANDVWKVVTAA